MKNIDKNIRYGVYVRKSSESEDRQIQSIERQTDDLVELSERDTLDVYENPIEESKSAFSPGREGFNRLVALTYEGKVNAWLCWHANRLSRNPVDAGSIIHLMDLGLLDHVRTPSRIYHNSPTDKMMLQIEFTMSKKDSDDKSVFVKSGLKQRYKKGFTGTKAPIGFINEKFKEKGNKGWLVDEENFGKLKLLFKRFLKGTDSISSITEYAQNELILMARPTKRQGHKLVQRSLVHYILRNTIYAGFFYSLDEDGKNRTKRELSPLLPRIITEDEHRKIINTLSLKTSPKTQSHDRPYLGFIYGAEGNYIGVDVKSQVICDCKKKFAYRNRECCPQCNIRISKLKSPKYLEYTLYYNVKRKRAKGLKVKTISEKKIDEFLISYFRENITICSELTEWTKQRLHEINDAEFSENQRAIKVQEQQNNTIIEEKRRLRGMFRKGMISEQEYNEDMKELESDSVTTKEIIEVTDWKEKLHEILDLGKELVNIIEKGSVLAKKEALTLLGSNLVWNEKNLSIHNDLWLDTYIEGRKTILSKYQVFEPKNNVDNKGRKSPFGVLCPIVRGWLYDVRKNYYESYYTELRGNDDFEILFI